jgi:glycerol kinase
VFQVEDVVAAVHEAVAPVDVLLADGGASANPVLMQLQADISGRTVHRAIAGDLSPLGAAHLAGRSIGFFSAAELAALDRPRRSFEPEIGSTTRQAAQQAWHAALGRARNPAIQQKVNA